MRLSVRVRFAWLETTSLCRYTATAEGKGAACHELTEPNLNHMTWWYDLCCILNADQCSGGCTCSFKHGCQESRQPRQKSRRFWRTKLSAWRVPGTRQLHDGAPFSPGFFAVAEAVKSIRFHGSAGTIQSSPVSKPSSTSWAEVCMAVALLCLEQCFFDRHDTERFAW